MIRQTLESITGVSIYPIFSFILFFSFFTLMLIWVFRKKKSEIDLLSNLPLDDNQTKA